MVMTHMHTKGQGQRSLGPKDRVEIDGRTDGRTDGADCIIFLINAVNNMITINIYLTSASDPEDALLESFFLACKAESRRAPLPV